MRHELTIPRCRSLESLLSRLYCRDSRFDPQRRRRSWMADLWKASWRDAVFCGGGFRGCDVSYTDWRGVVFRRGGKIRHRQMRWGSFRFRWLLLQEYERKGNKIGEIGSAGCREMQRRFVCDSCRVFWYFLLLWIVVVVSRSTWREAGFWCLKNQSFQKRPDRRAFHLTWCRWTGAR